MIELEVAMKDVMTNIRSMCITMDRPLNEHSFEVKRNFAGEILDMVMMLSE